MTHYLQGSSVCGPYREEKTTFDIGTCSDHCCLNGCSELVTTIHPKSEEEDKSFPLAPSSATTGTTAAGAVVCFQTKFGSQDRFVGVIGGESPGRL